MLKLLPPYLVICSTFLKELCGLKCCTSSGALVGSSSSSALVGSSSSSALVGSSSSSALVGSSSSSALVGSSSSSALVSSSSSKLLEMKTLCFPYILQEMISSSRENLIEQIFPCNIQSSP